MENNLIWDKWLVAGRQIQYGKFSHFEYEEQADQRLLTAPLLHATIERHHSYSASWMRLLRTIGFHSLSETLLGNSKANLPVKTTPSKKGDGEEELTTRRGNFCEVLAAEYAVTKMGFEVPIRRLRYNPNPDQAMKGDDVLGFRFSSTNQANEVLVGESKYRKNPSKAGEAVEKAYFSVYSPTKIVPVSLNFVATILELEKDLKRAQSVRQIRAQLESGQIPVGRHYLIFLGTLGRPKNPFQWLDQQSNVESNITCVNIVFADGIQDWLNKLFDGGL